MDEESDMAMSAALN